MSAEIHTNTEVLTSRLREAAERFEQVRSLGETDKTEEAKRDLEEAFSRFVKQQR